METMRILIVENRWEGVTQKHRNIITINVKNAFISAQWKKIYEASRKFIVLLKDGVRPFKINYTATYEVTGGISQGSVLGTPTWNVMYHSFHSILEVFHRFKHLIFIYLRFPSLITSFVIFVFLLFQSSISCFLPLYCFSK